MRLLMIVVVALALFAWGCDATARVEHGRAVPDVRELGGGLYAVDDTARGVTCYAFNRVGSPSCVKVNP